MATIQRGQFDWLLAVSLADRLKKDSYQPL
jgi:hypothetical protein